MTSDLKAINAGAAAEEDKEAVNNKAT